MGDLIASLAFAALLTILVMFGMAMGFWLGRHWDDDERGEA